MKHFGSYEGQTVILLGYNDTRGKVLVVNPMRLSNPDQEFLNDIVTGGYAQDRNNLHMALARENHPNGGDAWMHFCKFGTEIPVHHVTIHDETQAVAWMGSNAYYGPPGAQRGGLPDPEQARLAEAAKKEGKPLTEEMPAPQVAPAVAQQNAQNFRTQEGDVPAWQDPAALSQSGQPIPRPQPDVNAALLEAIGGLTDAMKGMEKKMGNIDKAMRTNNQVLKKVSDEKAAK